MTTTAQATYSKKDVLIISAITLVILAMFPLLAVVGLALQFGFVIALPLAVVALLAMPLLSRVRLGPRPVKINDITLPEGLYLHERHGWARRVRGGRYQVGADALLCNAFAKVDSVDLPEEGAQLSQGAPLVTLHGGGRTLTLKAPFSGTVHQVNGALRKDAASLQRDPYHGWLVELTPAAGVRSLDGLRDSGTARPWLTHEIDRMLALITAPGQAPVLADGARLDKGYAATLDAGAWERLAQDLF